VAILLQSCDPGVAGLCAAFLHLHARDTDLGRHSQDPAFFVPFLPKIKANTHPDRARIMLALKGGDRVNF
jgi:hypothetical protein